MCRVIILSFLSLALLFGHDAAAQGVEGYQKQRALLNDHIKMLDASLQGKQQEKFTISKNYQLLSKRIEKREQLQLTIAEEMSLIDSLIYRSTVELGHMHEMDGLRKEQLKKTVRMGYYQKITANPWLRLLSADNLKDALLKWRYNAQLQDYISDNIIELQELTQSVSDTISYLETIKAEKINLLSAEEQNLYALQSEYERSNEVLTQISNEENRIRNELNKQKNESERLNRLIGELIKKEEASAKATLSTNNKSLTGGFVENKRNLPWPVNSGVVTEKFGIRQHPTLKNVKTENLGIDMLCPADTKVTSIYEGTVLIVTYQPPYDNIAIVNHGDFTTAYYYLSEVYVQKGANIATGEVIGSLKKNKGNSDFHFEIWQNQRQVDPELWLLTKS